MIYITIYLCGIIITFGSLLIFEKRLDGDYLVFGIVSFIWPITVPLKICCKIFYFIKDTLRELFKEEPDENEQWDNYRNNQTTYQDPFEHPRPKKKLDTFKFGR